MKRIALVLVMVLALMGTARAEIDYEISTRMEKVYDGDTLYAIKWTGNIIFTGLTIATRTLLRLPLSYRNDKGEEVLYTDEDTTEIISVGNHIPYTPDEQLAKDIIIGRIEKMIDAFEKRLVQKSPEPISVSVEGKFKSVLTSE